MNTDKPDALALALLRVEQGWNMAHRGAPQEDAVVLAAEVKRLTALINTPEVVDFAQAVQLEATHQRARWGSDHDAGKADADWLWLLGYLAGKALHNPGPFDPPGHRAQQRDKKLHRIVTVAAAAANWHAQILGASNMRPGILPPAGETD